MGELNEKNIFEDFFIILVILIFITPIYCFGQLQGNEKDYTPDTPGEVWLAFDDFERGIYLIGVEDGILYFLLGLYEKESKYFFDSDEKKTKFLDFVWEMQGDLHDNLFVIRDIITNLYRDPANTYIPAWAIIGIAIRKLKGEDIEPLLRRAREGALLMEKGRQ